MDPGDSDQLERIRQKAYAIAEGGGPNADQARRILSKLPKIKVGQDIEHGPGMPKRLVSGELPSGGDIGAELPPTPDEQVGIPNNLEKPPLASRAAAALLSPSSRREFERGADKMLTGGLGVKYGNKLGTMFDSDPEHDFEKTEAADQGESPNARMAGELAGALSGRGMAGMAGKIGQKAFAPLASAGKGMLGRGLAGAVAGAGSNMVAMPLIAGAQEAVQGNNPLPAMKDQALSPINIAAGALLGFGSGTARGIRDTGQTGRDIKLVEKYDAKPNPFGGARGGVFDSPLMSEIGDTARDQGRASRLAAEKVMSGLDEEQGNLSREYGAAKKNAGDQGFLEGKIDPLFVREEAERLLKGERVTNSQRAAIQSEVMDALDRHPTGMSLDDFNDFRGKLGDIFGTGPKDAAHPAIDRLRQAAKRTVDETEMGPINEAYHKGTKRIERQQEQLGVSPNGRRDVNERRIANIIQRRANDEAPGAGIQDAGDLGTDQFLAENPRYQPAFDTASLLAAKERMAAGIEPHGGFFRRVGKHGLLEKNLEPALVGAYRLGLPLEKGSVPAALAAQFLLNGGQQ